MNYRRCREDDLPACAELLTRIYAEPPYQESWQHDQALAYLTRFYQIEAGGCYLVEEDDQPAAAVFSYSWPWQDHEITFVQELFVDEPYRRRGIAKTLLKQVVGNADNRLVLIAHEGSDATQLYKRLGLSEASPYRLYSGVLQA